MNKSVIYRPFCFFALALFFAFFPSLKVSAERLTEEEYYMYWYAENYLGVDWSQYSATDDGSTMEEYTERHGNKSFSQGVDDVANEVSTAANSFYSRVYENTKDTVNKYYTTSAKAAEYVGERANRTLQTAAGTAWSVAGGEFWESVFNDLFNNNGYKEQYATSTGNGYKVSTSIGEIEISFFGYTIGWGNSGGAQVTSIFSNRLSLWTYGIGQNSNSFFTQPNLTSTNPADCTDYFRIWYKIKLGQDIGYITTYGGGSPSPAWATVLKNFTVKYVENENHVILTLENGMDSYQIIVNGTIDGVSDSSEPVLLPSQVGFIQMPDGSIVPVYTDKDKNDFDINDNGTVTLPDGSVLPIYVYPDQINGDGKTQILKFIDGIPFQLPFGLNDSLPISSGDDGTFLEGLGKLIGDVFSGLLDGITEVIKTIAEAIKTLVGLIAALFKGDYYNNLKFQLFDFNPFDIIKSGVSKIFEIFGVVIS